MKIQVVALTPIPLVMISHVGPYDQLPAKFEQLSQWVEQTGTPIKRWIGVYWDNPEEVDASQLRSGAAVEVAIGFSLVPTGNFPVVMHHIDGGDYATTTYVGPYEEMEPAWARFGRHIEQTLKRTIITDEPAFEVYVNDPEDTAPADLITELYMPVK